MLDEHTKAALAKAAQAIASGKMKPGDSMIVAGDKHPVEESDSDGDEADDEALDQIGEELFNAKDAKEFTSLLSEFIQRCSSLNEHGKY